jgi:tetrahydromethanopterin S-methyltransferase subunit G
MEPYKKRKAEYDLLIDSMKRCNIENNEQLLPKSFFEYSFLFKKINDVDKKLDEINKKMEQTNKIYVKLDSLQNSLENILTEKDRIISNLEQENIELKKELSEEYKINNQTKISDYFY